MEMDGNFLHEEPPGYGGTGKSGPVPEYLRQLERALRRGDATEQTHRPAFKEFLEQLRAGITATNEPKRSACGAPDYVVGRNSDNLTLGYVEAKDIGLSLAEVEKSEQLKRYRRSLPNLLLTDYVEVRWFVNGERRGIAGLASLQSGGRLVPASEEEQAKAIKLIESFLSQRPVEIASAEELARRLAHCTHLIRDIIVQAFAGGQASQQLRDWRAAFTTTLLPELAEQKDGGKERAAVAEFADMFAQTLTYGLFSARAASGSTKFTRDKAQKLIPRTNPFLRTFFEQITGAALDEEPFAGFVEDTIQTLDHANMGVILEDFGKRGPRRDPVVHFYETFLQAYDPKLRELRGVYYTPEPVVNYIVQSIDRLLKEKFGLKDGLADRSKIKMGSAAASAAPVSAPADRSAEALREGAQRDTRGACAPLAEETHRVLILDPAAGTATFLYTVLDLIRSQFKKSRNAGQWSGYVHEHLLPRLFGFELLMAPYAVAHFKLGLALAAWDEEPLFRQQWSYEPHADERLNIFLTNTLEDLHRATEQLGPLRALSDEANSAYDVKQRKPVLVVLGNPPYSGHSANKGEWITKLVRDYYFCDGKPLGEKNPKWLQDDYVKFIRWGQWRIEQTGQGILAFITNHGYLDNPTFRGMRQNLMRTFDEIYVLDLHGNSKKKETVPGTGEPDKNVFDIQQGVAIGIFVKLPAGARKGSARAPRAADDAPVVRSLHAADASSEGAGSDTRGACAPLAIVRHCHLWGAQRKTKSDWLDENHVKNTDWTTLAPTAPHYLFIPQDTKRLKEYERGWKFTDMMPVNVLGFQTHRDQFAIAFDKHEIKERIEAFRHSANSDELLRRRYSLVESSDWNIADARKRIRADESWLKRISRCLYRPFDIRWCYFDKAVIDRPRRKLEVHVFDRDNLCLGIGRQGLAVNDPQWNLVMASTYPIDANIFTRGGINVAPLYLYPNGNLPEEDLFAHEDGRRPNLSAEFVRDLCAKLNVKFAPDGLGRPGKGEIGPELIFNYAYAVFHSPTYRERYADFLRADFPRLPLTSDFELFRALAGFGGGLVDLHGRGKGEPKGITYPVRGDNVIEDVRYQPPSVGGAHAPRVQPSAPPPKASVARGADDGASSATREARVLPETKVGRVWINDKQYFEGVPPAAWGFPIGGYFPAQRWLKDRTGRTLGYDDQTAYQKTIHALIETKRLMAEIDETIAKHGGWPLK